MEYGIWNMEYAEKERRWEDGRRNKIGQGQCNRVMG